MRTRIRSRLPAAVSRAGPASPPGAPGAGWPAAGWPAAVEPFAAPPPSPSPRSSRSRRTRSRPAREIRLRATPRTRASALARASRPCPAAARRVRPASITRSVPSVIDARMAASVTAWSGGLSTMTRSAAAARRSRIVRIRWDARSSAGLGGSGPVVTIRRLRLLRDLGDVVDARPRRSRRSVVRPRGVRQVEELVDARACAGPRRGGSPFRPAWAKATARLPAVVVLPSPGMELVTRRVRTGSSTEANSRFVRSVR